MSQAPAPQGPKINRPAIARLGLGGAMVGLAAGIAGLFAPASVLFLAALGVGGMIYIPSAFLVFWAERPMRVRPVSKILFWVRTAFALAIAIGLVRLMASGGR